MNDENRMLEDFALTKGIEDMEGKYLTFWTEGQLFGIPITEVVQIIGMQKITEIPDSPAYAKGIINLRGTIIPVFDIRLRFGKLESDYTDRTCVIVSTVGERSFGFIVDGVNEVANLPDAYISPPPQLGDDRVNQYLTGIARQEENSGERIILLINTKKLLGENEYNLLTQTAV